MASVLDFADQLPPQDDIPPPLPQENCKDSKSLICFATSIFFFVRIIAS